MIFKKLSATLVSFGFLLSGCATQYKVETDLVSKYQEPTPPTSEETQIYLIRGSAFAGGGRSIWVALNDKIVSHLDNGSHVPLKIKSKLNSINLVQNKAGFSYMAVDNRGGETIFAVLDYLNGTLKEVPRDLGISMVMKTTEQPTLKEYRNNDSYDNLLLNPELLNLGLINLDIPAISPDNNSAVINFYRPGNLIPNIPFSIWSNSDYVGSIAAKQYVQVRVAPGKHTFIALSERLSVLKAEVEAGKEYAVELDVGIGWNQAHIKLLPINLKSEISKVSTWKNELKLVGSQQSTLQKPEVFPRIEAGKNYIQEIKNQWLPADADARHLFPSDAQ